MPARKQKPRPLRLERLEWRCLLATVDVYFENFENGDGGYVADNTGGSVLGLWHYSIGRREDGLPNHSPDHNWYYGMFETGSGGGRYDVLPFDHQGTLKSPFIQLPACGTSSLSFSYVLNTRPELDRDFAEVFVIDDSGQTLLLSRASGTLPQTGYDQWLTATGDLSAFSGEQIMLLFSFRTGTPPQVDPEGWYIDDVRITNTCDPAPPVQADLSVNKEVNDPTPDELQTITYTITATSAASSSGTTSGVTVTDNLPAGVTFVSATPSEGSYDPATDLWSGLTLAPGEIQTLAIVATVNAGTAGQTFVNTAVIAGSNDPNPGNNSDSASITVNPIVVAPLNDLGVTKTVDDASPDELQTITYTITAASAASSAGTTSGVTVTDNLPAGVTFVSATPSEGSYDSLTDLWSGLALAPGETQTLTIVATVNAGTAGQTFVNTAVIAGSTDPNPGNNSDSATITVNPIVSPSIDLSVTKSVDDTTPDEGQFIAFTITVSNAAASTAAAAGVVVIDSLPTGVTFVSATATEGTYNAATDQWTGLDLAPGESRTLSILATVNEGTAGQALVNTAVVSGPGLGTDPAPGNNQATATAVVNSVVQFITPMSLYRLAGPFAPPAPVTPGAPAAGTATIKGFKWHDVDQDGVWDTGEPGRPGWSIFLDADGDNTFDPQTERLAVTATDGSYVFENLAPGTYFIREDRAELSAGTFQVQRFPAADPSGQRDADEHRVTVVAGQLLAGQFGVAEVPNFGSFDYSPLVRPADDSLRRFATLALAQQQTFLTASDPWQSFSVSNTTGRPLRITAINELIDTSLIAAADQFVTVFQRAGDGSLVTPAFPINLPAGSTAEFFAFYDPKVLAGDVVTAQFPDWFDDPSTPSVNESRTRPPHNFSLTDRLEVSTEFTDGAPAAGPTFVAKLVGASTYDSDIFYDSAVDRSDLGRLSDDLLAQAVSSQFDATSDINARHPNGAGQVVGTLAWPVAGSPAREIGYGDFGPLNLEMNRRRAPFLDLDSDDSTGGDGANFVAELTAGSAPIADEDARFANRLDLRLDSLVLTIINPLDAASENFNFSNLPAGITGQSQFSAGVRTLTLTGTASVETYLQALQSIEYINADATPTLGTRIIQIQAIGGNDFIVRDAAQQIIFDQRPGNIASAAISVRPAAAASSLLPEGEALAGEGETNAWPAVMPFTYEDWNIRYGSCERHTDFPLDPAALDQSALLAVAAAPNAGPGNQAAQDSPDRSIELPASPPVAGPMPQSVAAAVAQVTLAVWCDEETQAREMIFAQLAEDDLDLLAGSE